MYSFAVYRFPPPRSGWTTILPSSAAYPSTPPVQPSRSRPLKSGTKPSLASASVTAGTAVSRGISRMKTFRNQSGLPWAWSSIWPDG